MKIRWSEKRVNVADLRPFERNPRRISDQAFDRLVNSLEDSGYHQRIVATPDLRIVGGHQRIKALKKLKIKEIEVLTPDRELTDKEFSRILVQDNIGFGEFDMDMLLEDYSIDDLQEWGLPDDLLPEVEELPTEGLTDEDAVPEVPEKPVSQLGDIWLLGDHRLMCGDSTDAGSVALLMDGQKADMVFTDPPYGVKYQSNMRTKSAKFDVIKNDDVELDITPIIESQSSGWVFIWTTWKVINKWLGKTESLGYPSNMVVWHKGGGGIGDLKGTFATDWEVALVFNRGAKLCGKRIGSVWSIGKDAASGYIHPTQKPVSLAVEAIDKTAVSKAQVLDLFGGSGSTLIACEKTKRHARLMELDPKYCDVIIKRWQDYTGKEAMHEESGKSFKVLADTRAAA